MNIEHRSGRREELEVICYWGRGRRVVGLKIEGKGWRLKKWRCRYQESALRGRIALPYGLDQDDPATMKKWLFLLFRI